MKFWNGFNIEERGAHPFSVSTPLNRACALALSFSRGWDGSWRTGKSQIHSRAVSGLDLDPGTDPARVYQTPVDSLSETILPYNSIRL